MKKFVCSLLLLLLSGAAAAGEMFTPYTQRDWLAQGAYTVLYVMDYKQTLDIKNHDMHEQNPILGRNPSDTRIRNYFAATLAAQWLVTYALPREYRPYWQASSIGLELYLVGRNKGMGLHMNW